MAIPFTVIGGFLGAGKTTLLNRVLSQARGTRFAVLVNDFGALNVDAELVVAHGGETIALTNGCICCSIGDNLIDSLVSLMNRPDPADHILVEASGVSDPARIADVAVIDPALSLDGVVVLADAERVVEQMDDRLVGETVRQQIAAADFLLLNKSDIVGAEVLQVARAALSALAPETPIVSTSNADIPLELVFGGSARWFAARQPAHAPGHDEGHPTFHQALVTACGPLDRQTFEAAMAALPPSILRAKGMVRFSDASQTPYIVHRVGARWSLIEAKAADRPQMPVRLVFIGIDGMPDLQALHEAFCPDGNA